MRTHSLRRSNWFSAAGFQWDSCSFRDWTTPEEDEEIRLSILEEEERNERWAAIWAAMTQKERENWIGGDDLPF